MKVKRKINVFERLLLLVGIAIGMIGFYLLNVAYINSGRFFSLEMLNAVFLWMLLIFVMILAAINENQREELGIIIQEHVGETRILREETKLLRTISNEHLEEIKLLREDLALHVKKRK